MENTKPFYDLCIQDKCYYSKDFQSTVNKLIEYGYKTIAINQTVDEESLETNKKKKKGENREPMDIIPPPISITPDKNNDKLTILNRITVTFTEKGTMHKIMQSENLKKYHIFAVIPKSTDALQFTTDSVDADLISFDPADAKLAKFNRKIYSKAIERGLHFELMYYPAIQDSTLRKTIISKSHLYYQYGKSKNMIISSWAMDNFSIRNPYDVTNLGLILGLSEEKSKCAISSACTDLLNRAVGRRMGKSLIMVKSIQKKDVIEVDSDEDDDDEEMEVDSDEPSQKKLKVNYNNDFVMIDD